MTKSDQVLDPQSDWNQAPNDEPVFVLRAVNWKVALLIISITHKEPNRTADQLLETALAMKKYHEDTDIPF